MEYTKLGNSDLNVSRICMGCMGFGDPTKGRNVWTIDEASAKEIIRKGLEMGINFFDTAIAYQGGTSEEYVGRSLRSLAGRDEYIVATKFLPRSQEDRDNGISGQCHIENSLNQSLKHLGMDYVDLYIYHMWDYHTPMEEILEGLDAMVKAGKIRYLGISNCYAWQLAKANHYAEQHGLSKFVSIQGHYNLLFREEEREMVPFCEEENIALTPYGSLASGRLSRRPFETTNRLEKDTFGKFKYDKTAEEDAHIINRVWEVAEKRGVSMTEVALSWLLSKTTSPVVGPTKVSQLDGIVKALDLKLTEEENKYLEELYVPHALVGVMATNVK